MKSTVIAAVAGGLVLGGAVFLPMGANAISQEIKQVSASPEKVVASTQATSDELRGGGENTAKTSGLDPVASSDPTTTPAPTSTPDPIAVTGPTFSAGDDEGNNNDDDSFGEDSEDSESDD